MKNVVLEKTTENIVERINFKSVTDEKNYQNFFFQNLHSSSIYKFNQSPYEKEWNFNIINIFIQDLGFGTLELNKTVMHELHYNYINVCGKKNKIII